MANLTDALQQLREERERVQSQVEKLDSAISVLQDLGGGNGSSAVRTSSRGGRVVSAVARRRMATAQRARWAKVRQKTQTPDTNKPLTTSSPKRTLSAAARRKIAAAQRARWARVKARQAKKAA
jgi:hypothetical protein